MPPPSTCISLTCSAAAPAPVSVPGARWAPSRVRPAAAAWSTGRTQVSGACLAASKMPRRQAGRLTPHPWQQAPRRTRPPAPTCLYLAAASGEREAAPIACSGERTRRLAAEAGTPLARLACGGGRSRQESGGRAAWHFERGALSARSARSKGWVLTSPCLPTQVPSCCPANPRSPGSGLSLCRERAPPAPAAEEETTPGSIVAGLFIGCPLQFPEAVDRRWPAPTSTY